MTRPWERRGGYGRHAATRPVRDRILIVCEGQQTEPNYFRKFPVNIEMVELAIAGIGANTLSLVQEAIRMRKEALGKKEPYNQVWCVFDRDQFPPANFNEAFRLAARNEVQVAYSNQCFELWYFLHFHFNDSSIDRHAYAKKLESCIGRQYRKNDPDMYSVLESRQPEAIRNAKKLLACYLRCNPEKDDPSTNVYMLVEALNRFVVKEVKK